MSLVERKKSLYIVLLIISYLLLAVVGVALLFLIGPRLAQVDKSLTLIIGIVMALPLVLIGLGLLSIIITALTGNNFLYPSFKVHFILQFFYPLIMALFGLIVDRDSIRASYIALNNAVIVANRSKIRKGKLLILIPHCLQASECEWKITIDINNCRRCGKCVISDFLEIADGYRIPVEIATGGTIARRIVKEVNPALIIAVACERDLSSGILDVAPIPSIGIPNSRPEGPCINTRVSIDRIREALDFFLRMKKYRMIFGSSPI